MGDLPFKKGVEYMKTKKIITFATAASLLMGSMATPVYAAAFADINTVTWSGFKPFLEQAAELGLMKGYNENGKMYCKPRNNVTYCEAVQLMYSIMRVYSGQDVSNTTVTKWKPVISAYNIPTWAYQATAYGLENSILTTAELNKLQNGTKHAIREDVGMIFGRAIDTVNGYDIKSGAKLSYADKNSVSAAAVPYLELLNRVNLMVGDSDNNFNPKAKITRAEMAVLSVKSYNKLTETRVEVPEATKENTVVGTIVTSMVMQNGDLFISMKTNSGTNLSLFGVKGDVTARYDGEKIGFADIGTGDTVKVSYEGVNMSAIEVTYSKAGIGTEKEKEDKTTEETFELVDINDSKVTVKAGSKEKKFYLDDDVEVKLDGKKSSISKLEKALEEANYDVTLTLDEDEYVLEIEAVMNDNNPTEGTVEEVDEDEITIKAGSKEYTYPLAKDLDIEYDGKTVRFSKFEDDYDEYNYYVSLELNDDGEVEEIIIESMEDEYSGTLTSIGTKKIKFEAGGKTYEYDLADDVDVKIDGKKSSVEKLREYFRDDEKAYKVTVDLNRDDEVTEIIATPKFNSNNDGELEDIDEDEITIVVDDKKYTYDIAEDVEVEIDGKDRDLEDLIDFVGEYSFEVKLEFNNDGDVSKIEATLKEASEGELKDIVEAANRISIRAAGLSLDLTLAGSVDVTLDGEEVTLTELNDQIDYAFGDSRIYVELGYNSSGKVDEIIAHWEDVVGKLTDIDEDNDEITVKVDGSKETYELGRSVEFVYKLGASVDEDDYKSLSRYDDDLDGLWDFLEDCDKAKNDCTVALTLKKNKVVRIKATAE